jgi:hypothetical protein
MGKGDSEFLDQLTVVHCLGNRLHYDIWRPKLSDEVVLVKLANGISAFSAHMVWHVVEVWIIGHSGHGCIKVAVEFGLHVLIENSQDILLF